MKVRHPYDEMLHRSSRKDVNSPDTDQTGCQVFGPRTCWPATAGAPQHNGSKPSIASVRVAYPEEVPS